jgi:hypothetical protein
VNNLKQRVNDRPCQVCDVRQAVQGEICVQPHKETNYRSALDASADRQGAKRLLELALKGLAERQRIDEEIADIQKQIRGGGQRSRSQARPQPLANPQPQSVARPAQTGSRLTAAGRKKLSDLMKRRWAAKKRAAK